jgi:hypothetical protein
MKTVAFQRDHIPYVGDAGIPTIEELVDITELVDTLGTFCKQYTEDNEIYTVEVMHLIGKIYRIAKQKIEL